MPTIEHLKSGVTDARWFSRLGAFAAVPGFVRIRSLDSWADTDAADDDARIADFMEWLPTQIGAEDPIHHGELAAHVEKLGCAEVAMSIGREMYKLTLQSLRGMCRHSLLVAGSHDFTNAARGAALYTVRQAAMEIVAEVQTPFWSRLVPLYTEGHWPCGVMPNGEVVVL